MTTTPPHPLQELNGVGPRFAAKLEKLGIHKPADLLFHLPLRYQDRTRITPLRDLRPGADAMILAKVDAAQVKFGRRRSLIVGISDQSDSIILRFFHFSRNQQQGFQPGNWIVCFGEIRRGRNGLEMVHPEYRLHREMPALELEETLTPVYPTTQGIGAPAIRKLVGQAVSQHIASLREIIPPPIQHEFDLMSLDQALMTVHNPPPDTDTAALIAGQHVAQRRLATEELLAHRLALTNLRNQRRQQSAPRIRGDHGSWDDLKKSLEFTLTGAQQRVVNQLFEDIGSNHPALRLVQGDVGSGKTVVAAAAALRAIDSGYQVALMAPTELLAEQHRATFSRWFTPLGIEIAWLSGKMSAAQRRDALENITSGRASMIIGTHALFQQQVGFSRLGLMIIDEQHRFGVDQRLALYAKSNLDNAVPHQIIMSATPIPRSLAMILYADLDVSSIDELPPGRKPVTTVVLPDNRRREVAERIRKVCQCGQQVYWVCPLIEESDKLQAQAATRTHVSLRALLPELAIELLHGRMKNSDKDHIMGQFSQGKIDVLVATTVIEVGVDVPNASLMIIENAERLGLAQLHQLRGRVGRGSDQSNCVLMYQSPLGKLARERLGILRDTNDGFEIARKDLEHRGPGELLGTRQTGLQQLRVADLQRDARLFPKIEEIARALQSRYPEKIQPLIDRWIVNSGQYANV